MMLAETKSPKKRRFKPKPEAALRKAYASAIPFDWEIKESWDAIDKLWEISRAMVTLWNLALTETHWRLLRPKNKGVVWPNPTDFTGALQGDLLLPDEDSVKSLLKPVYLAKGISSIALNFWLTPVRESGEIPFKTGAVDFVYFSSDTERKVLEELAGSWSSYFGLRKNGDTAARPPRSKSPEFFQTLTWSGPAIKVKDRHLIVPGRDRKRLHLPLDDYLSRHIEDKKIAEATVHQNRKGVFQLSIVVKNDVPEPAASRIIRAIDFGAGDIAVSDSDGCEYLIPARRPDAYWQKRIEAVEAERDWKPSPKEVRNGWRPVVKNSKRWKKLSALRQKFFERQSNQAISFQRKAADRLSPREKHALDHLLTGKAIGCLVLGKPKTRLGLSQSDSGSAKQHYGVQNTGLMFRLFLYIKEKAAERGINVIEHKDPERKGELENPETKFFASRALLNYGCKERKVDFPKTFMRWEFKISAGAGDPREHKPRKKK